MSISIKQQADANALFAKLMDEYGYRADALGDGQGLGDLLAQITALPTQTGNAGKALTTDGAGNLSWASVGTSAVVFFDNSAYSKAIGVTATAGNYTEGAIFALEAAATLTGCKWYQPAGMTSAVTVKIWDVVATTTVASVVVSTPTAAAINTATFTSPVALTAGVQYALTVHDGVNQILYATSNALSADANAGAGTTHQLWGPHLWLYGFGFAAGDATPTAAAAGYNGLIPIYSVP